MDYAIVKTGGKQYRVAPGDVLDVELLPAPEGTTTALDDVLALSCDGQMRFGAPTVPGARVIAEVQSHYKDRKIIVYKYKAKTRYRRKRGHRQQYTRIRIQGIETPGGAPPDDNHTEG